MIEKLQIEDFQGHELLRVSLGRITTIVGPSDVGKSAAVRAVRWLVQNKPRGESFVRDGADQARVRLKVDGRKIERTRSKSKNEYKLDGERYVSFGSDAPEAISDVLRISDLNFQGQLDGPFWLALSAGEAAKQLNAIVDLGVIDETLGKLSKGSRKAKERAELCAERDQRAKAEAERLEPVERLEDLFRHAERWEQEAVDKRAQVDALTSLRRRAVVESGKARRASEAARAAVTAGKAAKAARDARKTADGLRDLRDRLKAAERLAERRPPAGLRRVDELLESADEAREAAERLDSLLGRLSESRKAVDRAAKEVERAERKLRDAFGGLCPLCGQPVGNLR